MKFMITYECRNNGGSSSAHFYFESEQVPTNTDISLLEAALRDSARFHADGIAGISITSISPTS